MCSFCRFVETLCFSLDSSDEFLSEEMLTPVHHTAARQESKLFIHFHYSGLTGVKVWMLRRRSVQQPPPVLCSAAGIGSVNYVHDAVLVVGH